MKRLLPTIAMMALSCAHADSGTRPQVSEHFSHLQNRDLSAFERSLAYDIQRNTVDEWTFLGKSWVAFANCDPIPEHTFKHPSIAFIEASMISESARRDLRILLFASEERFVETLGDELLSKTFFSREGKKTSKEIIWPGGNERWEDEIPASLPIESHCGLYSEKVLTKEIDLKKEKVSSRLAFWENIYYSSILNASHFATKVSQEKRKGAIGETIFKMNLEGIRYFAGRRRAFSKEFQRLRIQRDQFVPGQGGETSDESVLAELDKSGELAHQKTKDYSQKIEKLAADLQRLVPIEGLRFSSTQLAIARSVLAMLAVEEGRFNDARVHLYAEASELADFDDDQFAWLSRYLDIRVNSALGHHAQITKRYDNALPNRQSKYYGPYVYRLAFSLKQAGAEDRFYGIVKSAFRDKSYKSDPFLRALYLELLASLSAVSFDSGVADILEELGPRGETFERVEELARVALDGGYPDNARAAAQWLIDHHKNAKFHPRYHAIAALSAFQKDDELTFKKDLKAVIFRSEAVVDAIAKERRPAFFKHADTELTRVLQRIIPDMAEWGDSTSVEKRRQKWLTILVKVTQDFLHNDAQSLARNALIEVYRLASGLLKEDPRGYAERVGEAKLRPLVLGQVVMESTTLEPYEPGIDLGISIVFSTTLVPDTIPFTDWKDHFSPQGDRDE